MIQVTGRCDGQVYGLDRRRCGCDGSDRVPETLYRLRHGWRDDDDDDDARDRVGRAPPARRTTDG